MATNIIAICPKCEQFKIVEPASGPIYYCVHKLPTAPWWEVQEISSNQVPVEKIQCKVIKHTEDANENS